MEEGDEYVPQLSQLPLDYGSRPIPNQNITPGGGGMQPFAGMLQQQQMHQMQQQQQHHQQQQMHHPSSQYAQMGEMMHGMPANPYMQLQQGMQSMQPPQQIQPVTAPPQPTAPAKKPRVRKKAGETAATQQAAAAAQAAQSQHVQQQQHQQQQADPMASMAALSHNPMMRAYQQQQQPQMPAGYPPHGYGQQSPVAVAYRPPPGYPGQHMYDMSGGQQQQPPPSAQPQQHSSQQQRNPQAAAFQQAAYNPYYPNPGQPLRYPQMHPQYYMDPSAYYRQADALGQQQQRVQPQVMPGQSGEGWGTNQQLSGSAAQAATAGGQLANPYAAVHAQQQTTALPPGSSHLPPAPPSHHHHPPAPSPHHPSLPPGHHPSPASHHHMEMMQCQQHLQRLYASQRTPIVDQEIARFEQRLNMLQQMATVAASTPGHPGYYCGPQVVGRDPSQGQPQLQNLPSHGLLGSQSSAPPSTSSSLSLRQPVSVTGGSGQIQVNIKPEQSGHTLISVYHQPPDGPGRSALGGGYPDQNAPGPSSASSGEASKPSSTDSIPPEPIPSHHHSQSSVPDPYGITSNGAGSQPQQMVNGGGVEMMSHNRSMMMSPSQQPTNLQQVPLHLQPTAAHMPPAFQQQKLQSSMQPSIQSIPPPQSMSQALQLQESTAREEIRENSSAAGSSESTTQEEKGSKETKDDKKAEEEDEDVDKAMLEEMDRAPRAPAPAMTYEEEEEELAVDTAAEMEREEEEERLKRERETLEEKERLQREERAEKAEEERIERDRIEQAKAEEERAEKEKEETENLERQRLEKEKADTEEEAKKQAEEKADMEEEAKKQAEENAERIQREKDAEEKRKEELRLKTEKEEKRKEKEERRKEKEREETRKEKEREEKKKEKEEKKKKEKEERKKERDEVKKRNLEEKVLLEAKKKEIKAEEFAVKKEVKEEVEVSITKNRENGTLKDAPQAAKDEGEAIIDVVETATVGEDATMLVGDNAIAIGDAASTSDDTTPFTAEETPGADVQDESISRKTEEDWSKKENSSVEKEKKQPARRRRGRAAPSSRRKASGGRQRSVPSKTKKRKYSMEESDQDDEFILNKKRKRRECVVSSTADFPMDLLEKRRSGRTKQNTQRYAAEAKEEEVMRELDFMEESGKGVQEDSSALPFFVTQNTVVEKILKSRRVEGSEEEFLAKFKGRAYVHCEWLTAEALEDRDKRTAGKIKRFKAKKTNAHETDDEDFNSDFTVVERVLSVEDSGEEELALVKWRSLPYDEASWEPVSDVPQCKIDQWKSRQVIDKSKLKEKSRPEANEWQRLDESRRWKDGNKLREYQFEGVSWLLYCYHHKQNCILADEMGLGKTVQTITFLQQVYDYGIHGPFLIVVPLSTVHNWMREFETWTDLNVVVYHGSAAARQLLQHYEFYYEQPAEGDASAKSWRRNVFKLDALITTFEMVVTDVEILRKIPFRVCVIDEAHRLKNRNCKLLTGGLASFKMEHRVLLTGTPLQNNIEELYSLLNFLSPAQFPSPEAFMEQFGQCKTDEQVQKLQEILKPMMLRRLKEDVEKTLQPKQETIIQVQLSDMQKKYYRAILERNFSHLCKGTSQPALMNAMMELRKCCNHPFLIQGAEENILQDMKLTHPDMDEDSLVKKALVMSSGKMVLVDKLLPKLKADGHKVLIFSQMVKVLDLIEEFLVNMKYTFERIDGNVRGDVRQAAIDRFSKPDADRFVFLLCTRAGGLGINLTAADTVIIFDSDWNPQNDLQAQARCHRIGQTKTVKVYRLITANTYEREMFEKASLKLGLDKAVLQSTHALRENSSSALTRKEVEELLKKGAYGSIMDEDAEGSKFNEEDIETILQRRTTTITLEAGVKGSTFSKATFNSSGNEDIDIDDPNFWSKWAEKANINTEKALGKDEKELIVSAPRQRKKRFEPSEQAEEESGDDSQEEPVTSRRGTKRGAKESLSARKRRKGDEDVDYVTYRPDELTFNKSEFFRVEKLLASWSWGRWAQMKAAGDLEVSEMDMEHMARTLLLHCLREFRGDDKTKEFIWNLISPLNAKQTKLALRSNQLHEGWAALPEYNPPAFALDSSFQRHVHRHANKLLTKVELLHCLEKDIIANSAADVLRGKKAIECKLAATVTVPEPLCTAWDAECDKSLLIAVYKYGLEGVDAARTDEALVFSQKKEVQAEWPSSNDLMARARRLLAQWQRNLVDPVYDKMRWSRREEQEYMRVLRAFGMRDKHAATPGNPTVIDWATFRSFSPALEKKSDEELQEQLYCILAMCTRAHGGELSPLDVKRALAVDAITHKRAKKLMNRLHLTRKIHTLCDAGLDTVMTTLKLCSTEAMPSGWTAEQDKELLLVCHEKGIDNITSNVVNRPVFQKLTLPTEKTLLRRLLEICVTLETRKWNGAADTDTIEDSDDERRRVAETIRQQAAHTRQSSRRSTAVSAATASTSVASAVVSTAAATTSTPSTSNTTTVRAVAESAVAANSAAEKEQEKIRAMLQHSIMRCENEQAPLEMLLQSMMMPPLTSSSSSSSNNSLTQAQQAALLQSLFALPSTNSSNNQAQLAAVALMEMMNLSKKEAAAAAAAEKQKQQLAAAAAQAAAAQAQAQAAAAAAQAQQLAMVQNNFNLAELLLLANMPPETRVPVINTKTKERLSGDSAPQLKNLPTWLGSNPDFTLDMNPVMNKKEDTPSSSRSKTYFSTPSTSTPSTSKASASVKPSVHHSKLEPGEIPRPSTSKSVIGTPSSKSGSLFSSHPSSAGIATPASKSGTQPYSSKSATASTSKSGTSNSVASAANAAATPTLAASLDPPVPVCSRTNGSLLPQSQWPSLSKLPSWLNDHQEANVHPNGLLVAFPVIATTHPDRLQLIAPSAQSAASAAAANKAQQELQLQMLIQQSMLSQLSFFPFSAPGLSSVTPSTSSAASTEEALQQQLLMAMLNPLAMQSMLDPSMLRSSAATLPSSSGLSAAMTSTPAAKPSSSAISVSTSTTTPTTSSAKSKTSKLSKLNAVVDKLNDQKNNQS